MGCFVAGKAIRQLKRAFSCASVGQGCRRFEHSRKEPKLISGFWSDHLVQLDCEQP